MAKLCVTHYPVRFGENEMAMREMWGLRKSDMAKIAGVQTSTVTAWEDEKLVPPLDIVSRIGSYFDVHPAVLLWGDTVLTDSTPVIRMGLLNEEDHRTLLAMRDEACGTLALSLAELDLVREFRSMEPAGRLQLQKMVRERLRLEERIREQL